MSSGQELLERIWRAVASIPRGTVDSYGGVASRAGLPRRARLVGHALKLAPAALDLPWHRVLNASGRISFAKRTKLHADARATAGTREELGPPEVLLADNGYFSEANVAACGAAGIEPLIALGRERHHRHWRERFAPAPAAPEHPTPVEAMADRLATPEGKRLYALRKQTPEPVFGIIKS